MNYKVVVHESEEGFSVSCSGLPGCWSQGETEPEALANIQDAIREYLGAIDDLVKGQHVREVNVTVWQGAEKAEKGEPKIPPTQLMDRSYSAYVLAVAHVPSRIPPTARLCQN
jgi:predicted RNase H-like HicB family nuclease